MVLGLWHEVILKKYLRNKSVKDWFREGKKNQFGISNIWIVLTSSFNIVADWLAWIPSNAKKIRIESHPMVGAHKYYRFTNNSIQSLKDQGIEFLAQVRERHQERLRQTVWKKAW